MKPAADLDIYFIYVIIFVLFMIAFFLEFRRKFFKINQLIVIFNETYRICQDVREMVGGCQYEKRIVFGILKIVALNFILVPVIYTIQYLVNLKYYVKSSYESGIYKYGFIIFAYLWMNLNICLAFMINWIFGYNIFTFKEILILIDGKISWNLIKGHGPLLIFNTINKISVIYSRQVAVMSQLNQFYSAEFLIILSAHLINLVWISFTIVVLLIYICILNYPLELGQMMSFCFTAGFYFLQIAIISNISQNVINEHHSFALYLNEISIRKYFNRKLKSTVCLFN